MRWALATCVSDFCTFTHHTNKHSAASPLNVYRHVLYMYSILVCNDIHLLIPIYHSLLLSIDAYIVQVFMYSSTVIRQILRQINLNCRGNRSNFEFAKAFGQNILNFHFPLHCIALHWTSQRCLRSKITIFFFIFKVSDRTTKQNSIYLRSVINQM